MAASRRARWVVVALAVLGVLLWWSLRERGSGSAVEDGDGASERGPVTGPRDLVVAAQDDEGVASRLAWRSGRAAISGTVHDPRGQPIAGAQACAWLTDRDTPTEMQREPRCTTTDASGRYRIGDLPAAVHDVHASAAQHIPAMWRDGDDRTAIELAPGQERTGIDLVLEPGGVAIRGIVKDITGGVIEGAWVRSGGDPSWFFGDTDRAGGSVRSDEHGEFTLWSRPGTISVSATAEGYTTGSRSGVAPGFRFEIVLTPESVIVGRVVRAASGAPVPDAKVSLGWSWGGSGGVAFTDAEGHFRLGGLQPGRYEPIAHAADGLGRAERAVLLGLGETSDETVIAMHPATTVRGRVAIGEPAGPGCPSGVVTLTSKVDKDEVRWQATKVDGTVEITGILPDTYEVTVWCQDRLADDRYDDLVVAAEPMVDLVWVARDGLAIRGVVIDDAGTPVPAADVFAEPKDAAPRSQMTYGWGHRTDVDGRFDVGGMVAGTYAIRVAKRGFVEMEPLEAVVSDGSNAEVRVVLTRGGRIAGRVHDARGEPVAGASVVARGDREGWRAQAMTSDEGTFEIEAVEPGTQRVAAMMSWQAMRAPGESDDDVHGERVTVVAGETVEVDLQVEDRSGSISGRVVDGDGGPITDAFVQASREPDAAGSGAGWNRLRARWGDWDSDRTPRLVDQDGEFTIDDLGPGQYTVFATRKGGGEGLVEHVAVGKTGVKVRIVDTASISGRVGLAGGGAPERFTVSVTDREAGVSEAASFFRTDGRYTIEGLPPGDFEVGVQSSDGFAKKDVPLADGEALRGVDLELVPRVIVSGRIADLVDDSGVPNLSCTITPAVGWGWSFEMSTGGDRQHVTDGDGRFTVRDAPSGKVRVVCMPMNWGEPKYDWVAMRAFVPSSVESFELPDIRIAKRRLGVDQRAGDLGFEIREPDTGTDWEDFSIIASFVRPGGPADAGGLKVGDTIVTVDGHDVTGDHHARFDTLSAVPPGTRIDLGIAGGRTVAVVAGDPR